MRALIAAAILAFAATGCAADELASQNECIILANGGNKLCGADARAWCDTTDELREGVPELGVTPDYESQRACDEIRR